MIDIEELERLANKVLGLGEWARLNDMSVEVYQKSGRKTRYIGEGRDEAHAEYIAAACNAVPNLIQRIRELEKREKEGWLLADQKIIELKAVKNELKQDLKVIINKNEQLIDKNEQIIALEKEADILADRLACHNPNCDCGFDVKYWRNWAREKRE